MQRLACVWVLVACILSVGCKTQPLVEAPRKAIRSDFSGSWEMDYSLNDSLEAKLDQYFYGVRRELQRQSNLNRPERRQGQGYRQLPSANNIIAMARFADQITRTSTLDIEQTYTHINVDRDDNFTLSCNLVDGDLDPYQNPFGKEICGWDGHQLVFYLSLPGGLSIQHRLTLGPDGEQLNVATTIYSDQVAKPFTLNRAYMQYERLPSDFRCKQTVTKGKVCTVSEQEKARLNQTEAGR